ncbi:MAG: hypothetical protein E7172_02415 [Firmicutes bacterium]|nr:hypothetical protein [Bacillota bacterium]
MKVFGNILAGFVSFLYFIFLLAMLLILFISNIFKKDYYQDILNEIKLSEIKLADFGITELDGEFNEDATVEDVLVKAFEESGIAKNDALKIINNEKINEVVGEFISDTVLYITTEEKIPQVDYQDVLEIIKSDDFSNVLDVEITDAEVKEIVDELNQLIKDEIGEF